MDTIKILSASNDDADMSRTRRAGWQASLLAVTMLGSVAAATPASAQLGEQESSEVETIFVEARKTLESLQEVPTSVSVVGAEQISDLVLQSVSDIASITPGLFFDDGFGRNSNRPIIRGQANILGDSGVSYFIDGIYFSGSISDFDVTQIERVEVIKGPQSALYGRNTYSGAINIITKSATDELTGRLSVDISEDDRYEVNGGLSFPIGGGFSGGLYTRYVDFGGQFINEFDGSRIGEQNSFSISSVINYDNGGPLTGRLRAYYNQVDDGQPAVFQTDPNDNNCFIDNDFGGRYFPGQGYYFCGAVEQTPIETDYTRQFTNADEVGLEAETINVSLRLDYEISDELTLTSLTGYNRRDETQRQDGDYSARSFQFFRPTRFPIGAPVGFGAAGPVFPYGHLVIPFDFSFANDQDVEDVSQELRLFYEADRFNVLVGGYYFNQSNNTRSVRDIPPGAFNIALGEFGLATAQEAAQCAAFAGCASIVPLGGPAVGAAPRNENELDIRNLAVFGLVEVKATDTISLTTEFRYQSERIQQDARNFNLGDPRPAVPDNSAQATFNSLDVRVTADWQITQENLLFAIFSTGQKPGGFNGVVAIEGGVPTFDEEEVTAFEIGSKNLFFDGALTANFALFYNNVRGYQLTQNVFLPEQGNSDSATVNAGDADIFGAEIEMSWRITDSLTLSGNYALASSEFRNGFDEEQGRLLDVEDDGIENCSTGNQFPDEPGCTSAFGSIEGKRIPRAPVHQAFVDIDYRTDISDDWQAFGGANVRFVSRTFAQVHNEAFTEAAATVDARLGVTNGQYTLRFYARNLFDDDTPTSLIRYADISNNLRRSIIGAPRLGRRFGVNLTASF